MVFLATVCVIIPGSGPREGGGGGGGGAIRLCKLAYIGMYCSAEEHGYWTVLVIANGHQFCHFGLE